LIHKAVGWMQREAGKRDAAVLDEFLGNRSAEARIVAAPRANVKNGMVNSAQVVSLVNVEEQGGRADAWWERGGRSKEMQLLFNSHEVAAVDRTGAAGVPRRGGR